MALASTIISFAQSEIKVKTLHFTSQQGILFEQDVYLPPGDGPFPVILIRTPYGKYQYKGDGNFFAQHGYVTVIQDVRGKFGSKGHFIPFLHETDDGLATLDWIAEQNWCDGEIGIYGISYSGFCGLTLSNKQHKALKAVVNFSGWVRPSVMAAPGGAQHLMLNLTWLLHEETQTSRNILEYDLDSLLNYLPLSNVFRSIGIKSDAWENPDLLGTINEKFNYSKVDIPILHLTGAYDFVKEATIEAYTQSKINNPKHHKLIFGPWFHNQSHTSLTEVGHIDFGESSLYGDEKVLNLALQWMDQHLKNETPRDELPHARVFLMFENKWHDFENWPPEGMETTEYFIDSKNGANSISGDGQLIEKKRFQSLSDAFVYNPLDPVPTMGGANFHFFPGQLGIKDQTEVEQRNDVLVYESSEFSNEKYVIGNPKFVFYASSSAPDTDFTAKLVLVQPDGTALNIVDGILRTRFRKGLNQNDLLEKKEVYPFEIELGTTAFMIPKGHKIRLEVSSSNFPKYNRNTNTKEDSFYSAESQIAHQKIYHSRQYPSRLILPMMEAK